MSFKKTLIVILILSIGIGLWWFVQLNTSRPVRVAVIDTGVNVSELKHVLARNSKEIPDNKKDDDQNGYVDDIWGWNFFSGNADIKDEADHGTQVAKTIVNNFTAENKNIQIIPIKVIRHYAGLRLKDLKKAIHYAHQRGAKIIHLSLGLHIKHNVSKQLKKRKQELGKQIQNDVKNNNLIFIAAAGEGATNPYKRVHLKRLVPQNFPQVIVVGAATDEGKLHPDSNQGPELNIVAHPPSSYEGSSFSAARVSGSIASILFENPHLDSKSIFNALPNKESKEVPLFKARDFKQNLGL